MNLKSSSRDENTCLNSCVKLFFLANNTIVTLVGFGLMVLSVWLLILRNPVSDDLHRHSFDDNKLSLVIVLMVTSILIIFLGFCGFYGVLKENRCLLATYFLFMLTSLALVIMGGVLVHRLSKQTESILREEILLYGKNPISTAIIDKAQEVLKCCGVEDFNSWKALNLTIPESCCLVPDSISCRQIVNSPTASGSRNVTGIIHLEGCASKKTAFLKVSVPILAVVGVVNVLGDILSLILCLSIKEQDYSSQFRPLLHRSGNL